MAGWFDASSRKERGNRTIANMLREHLGPQEEVLEWIMGVDMSVKRFGVADPRPVYLVATNKRLIFYRQQILGFKLKSFRYDSISSIEAEGGWGGTKLYLTASNNDVVVENITDDVTPVISKIQQLAD